MSGMVGMVGGCIAAIDDSINDSWFKDDNRIRLRERYQLLWPSSTPVANTSVILMDKTFGRDWGKFKTKGVHARKMFYGVTKDSIGNPLAGCSVDLFNTATDILVDSTVSNALGEFNVGDPNGVACYLVSYKTGTPDVAGTSANTLMGV